MRCWSPGTSPPDWQLAVPPASNTVPKGSTPVWLVNTSLAGHVWRLKDGNHPFNIKWRTLATYPDYNPSTNSCRLCLMEKFTIMCKPELAAINQRDEFFTPCLHKQAKLLDNAVT